jgi:hypothetical protein
MMDNEMPLINVLMNLSDVIFFVLLGENRLKKTKTGEQLFKRLESGIVSWTHTRANAEILAEVSALKKFFLRSAVIISIVLFLLTNSPLQNLPVVQQIIVSLGIIFLIACVGLSSLDWTFNHRSSIRDFLGFKTVFVLATTLAFVALTAKPSLEPALVELFKAKGFGTPAEYEVNFFISLLLGVSLIVIIFLFYIFAWVSFGGLSFLIVGMIYITSLLSKLIIKTVNRDAAWALVFLASVLIRILKNFL